MRHRIETYWGQFPDGLRFIQAIEAVKFGAANKSLTIPFTRLYKFTLMSFVLFYEKTSRSANFKLLNLSNPDIPFNPFIN